MSENTPKKHPQSTKNRFCEQFDELRKNLRKTVSKSIMGLFHEWSSRNRQRCVEKLTCISGRIWWVRGVYSTPAFASSPPPLSQSLQMNMNLFFERVNKPAKTYHRKKVNNLIFFGCCCHCMSKLFPHLSEVRGPLMSRTRRKMQYRVRTFQAVEHGLLKKF